MNEVSNAKLLGRIAGVILLITIFCATFSEFSVREALIDMSSYENTARNIINNENKFRWAMFFDLLLCAIELPLVAIFYTLLKRVSKVLSLTTSYFRIFMLFCSTLKIVFHYLPLVLLRGDSENVLLSVFTQPQLHSMVLFSFEIHSFAMSLALVFLSLHVFFLGILIAKSDYFPFIFGLLMSFSSLGYLIDGLSHILYPSFKPTARTITIVTSMCGDPLFCLYLCIMGARSVKSEQKIIREDPVDSEPKTQKMEPLENNNLEEKVEIVESEAICPEKTKQEETVSTQTPATPETPVPVPNNNVDVKTVTMGEGTVEGVDAGMETMIKDVSPSQPKEESSAPAGEVSECGDVKMNDTSDMALAIAVVAGGESPSKGGDDVEEEEKKSKKVKKTEAEKVKVHHRRKRRGSRKGRKKKKKLIKPLQSLEDTKRAKLNELVNEAVEKARVFTDRLKKSIALFHIPLVTGTIIANYIQSDIYQGFELIKKILGHAITYEKSVENCVQNQQQVDEEKGEGEGESCLLSVEYDKFFGCVIKLVSQRELFAEYAVYYEILQNAIHAARRENEKFAALLQRAKEAMTEEEYGVEDISDFLVIPVQRFMQTKVLLTEMSKFVTDEFTEFTVYTETQSVLKESLEFMNKKKREWKNRQTMESLNERFDIEVKERSHLHKEGKASIIKDSGKNISCRLYAIDYHFYVIGYDAKRLKKEKVLHSFNFRSDNISFFLVGERDLVMNYDQKQGKIRSKIHFLFKSEELGKGWEEVFKYMDKRYRI